MKQYDIPAYIWPSYTGKEPRSRIYWPQGIGEWQSVLSVEQNAALKPADYRWDRKPIWGPVDEADPKVMEMEIETAVSHGVNVFIYDWYWFDHRPFLEQCLDEGFLGASNNEKMKFYLMWANHDADYTWDIRLSDPHQKGNCMVWGGWQDRKEFEIICHRIIDNYFSRPNYYKINGKPVFNIYTVDNLVKGLGGVEETVDALNWFRDECVKAGHAGLDLQLTGGGEYPRQFKGPDGNQLYTKDVVPLLGFDSVTNYQFAHYCYMAQDYGNILKKVAEEYARMDRDYTVPYYPHVTIGWDNNPRFRTFADYVCQNNGPDMFEKGLRMAKDYVDSHDLPVPLITINSWNEWTETSYLEPDTLYGYGYLEAIKKVFVDGE